MKLSERKTLSCEFVANLVEKRTKEDIREITASIKDHREILDHMDLKDNNSFAYFVGELANPGLINRNGHGVTLEDGIKFHKNFESTFLNSEHDRSKIIGYVMKSKLTDRETGAVITEEEALAANKPVNISVGFLVWKSADPQLFDLMDKVTDTEDGPAKVLKLSWEISFDEYNILAGSMNQFEGELITDEKRLEELYESVKEFGGSGLLEDGKTPIYLIATGNIEPLGVGVVLNPAAYVDAFNRVNKESLANYNEDIMSKLAFYEQENSKLIKEKEELIANNNKLKEEKEKNKSSQIDKPIVSKSSMKIKSASDITDEVLASKEVTASEVNTFISEELARKSAEYKAEVEAKEGELALAKAESEKTMAEVEATRKQLETIKEELKALNEARASEKAEGDFNTRMSILDEEFELEDADREILASQIRGLSDEEFTDWKKGFDILAKQKSKEFIKANAPKIESKASLNEDNKDNDVPTKDPIEELKAKNLAMPNSAISYSQDSISKYKSSFTVGEGVTIS